MACMMWLQKLHMCRIHEHLWQGVALVSGLPWERESSDACRFCFFKQCNFELRIVLSVWQCMGELRQKRCLTWRRRS